MDAFRHWLALFLLLAFPVPLVFWLVLHPAVRLWRRTGPAVAWVAAAAACGPPLATVWILRDRLLAVDLGTRPVLIALGIACIAAAAWIFVRLKRELPMRTQIGLTELRGESDTNRLVQGGIYARIRHPRYVELALASTGECLIANHLATYVALVLLLAGLHAVVCLEERELRDRFGDGWERYARSVPRYMPVRRRTETDDGGA